MRYSLKEQLGFYIYWLKHLFCKHYWILDISDGALLCRELNINKNRAAKLIMDFYDLVCKYASTQVVFNTLSTLQYTSREKYVLYYLWGRFTDNKDE
jgi:hypothetical protein